jgi:hypothetical protein
MRTDHHTNKRYKIIHFSVVIRTAKYAQGMINSVLTMHVSFRHETSEVFMAVKTLMMIVWVVMPCSLVDEN